MTVPAPRGGGATAVPPWPPVPVYVAGPSLHDPLSRAGVAISVAMLPILLPTGPGNLAPADVGGLIAIGAVLLWAGWTHVPLRLPYGLGVGVIALAGTLAALFGDLPADGLLAVLQDIFLLFWAAALANFARTPENARFLVNAWSLSASLWAVGLVLFFGHNLLTAGSADQEAARIGFTFSDENGAGLYFALSILVILAARRPRRMGPRVTALVFHGLGMMLSGSLGAISGLFAGLALALVVGVRSRRGAALALVLLLALPFAMASVLIFAQRYQVIEAAHQSNQPILRNSLGRGYQSSASRAELARESYGLWESSHPLGRGPVSTQHLLREEQAPYPKEAHNDWLASLVERGVLGAAGLLLLVGEIVWWASRAWDVKRFRPGFAAALPAPQYLVGGLGTVFVFSLTHEVLHDRTVWVLLSVLSAFGMWAYRRPSRV